jgi:hypothetical protein
MGKVETREALFAGERRGGSAVFHPAVCVEQLHAVPAPAEHITCHIPLRFKLGGRPILSADFKLGGRPILSAELNVEMEQVPVHDAGRRLRRRRVLLQLPVRIFYNLKSVPRYLLIRPLYIM